MSLAPLSIATKGYVCGGEPRDISIATKGYVCIAVVPPDRRDGDGGTGIRRPHGAVIMEPRRESFEDEQLALLAVLAIEEWYG